MAVDALCQDDPCKARVRETHCIACYEDKTHTRRQKRTRDKARTNDDKKHMNRNPANTNEAGEALKLAVCVLCVVGSVKKPGSRRRGL